MVFRFGNASEARRAVTDRLISTPIIVGHDGARQEPGPACHACGNVGSNKHVDGTQIVCVDAVECCRRYRLWQTAEHYARVLQADLRAAADAATASSVEHVMSGAL